jgi:hypothetical protein
MRGHTAFLTFAQYGRVGPENHKITRSSDAATATEAAPAESSDLPKEESSS